MFNLDAQFLQKIPQVFIVTIGRKNVTGENVSMQQFIIKNPKLPVFFF